jgi:hypothetical protein
MTAPKKTTKKSSKPTTTAKKSVSKRKTTTKPVKAPRRAATKKAASKRKTTLKTNKQVGGLPCVMLVSTDLSLDDVKDAVWGLTQQSIDTIQCGDAITEGEANGASEPSIGDGAFYEPVIFFKLGHAKDANVKALVKKHTTPDIEFDEPSMLAMMGEARRMMHTLEASFLAMERQ